ncbi:hypothetical protein AmDm5_0709 [Acetobacter malorum]|nr:hypothetical protein AmDm5_0709 [Acetobacter malorum]
MEARDIFLIAGQAVHRFCQNDLEAAVLSIGDQGLNAWPYQRCAGNCPVGITVDDRPALRLGISTAEPELILNRGLSLIVRRITGVKRNFHHLDLS